MLTSFPFEITNILPTIQLAIASSEIESNRQ
jgi:hypothetical protein